MMKKLNQKGEVNLLLIPLILISLLLIGAIVFGFWAYSQRQDYKNNSDQKVAVAVKQAQLDQQQLDTKLFLEKAKKPLVAYKGPSDFGSLVIKYPKTWSVYVNEADNSNAPIDGYGHPNQVPGDDGGKTAYALRFQVVNDTYDEVVKRFDSQLRDKTVKIKPYHAKKVPKVIGVRVDGLIDEKKQGSMVILPLRDKTLKVWTEASQFEHDFNKYILPNFSFQP